MKGGLVDSRAPVWFSLILVERRADAEQPVVGALST